MFDEVRVHVFRTVPQSEHYFDWGGVRLELIFNHSQFQQ